MSGRARRLCSLLGVLALGCAEAGVSTRNEAPDLVGAVAVVGGRSISEDSVRRLAEQRGLAPPAALDILIGATLLERSFSERFPSEARYLRRIALARAASEQLAVDARAQGPVTDVELADFTERHWKQLSRPETVRTSHVLVSVEPGADEAPARAWLNQLRTKLLVAESDAEFRDIATAEPVEGLEVKVEALPPVAADGRIVDVATPGDDGRFDASFTRAAISLPAVGAISDPVRTQFGLHLIYLTERLSAREVDVAERRRLALPEVHGTRARQLEEKALAAQTAALKQNGRDIQLDPGALSLMERVRLER